MVQIQPYHKLLEDSKVEPITSDMTCTMPVISQGSTHHRGLIDLSVMKTQTKIVAMQKTSEKPSMAFILSHHHPKEVLFQR